MDEVEVIQSHLLSQAGEGTDVILGLGYDSTLGDKLGITLIATGFEHKDPFKESMKKPQQKKEEKIIMVLGQPEDENVDTTTKPEAKSITANNETSQVKEEPKPEVDAAAERLMPRLVEEFPDAPMPGMTDFVDSDPIREEEPTILLKLQTEEELLRKNTGENSENTVSKLWMEKKDEGLISSSQSPFQSPSEESKESPVSPFYNDTKNSNSPAPAASGGYLARPSNIYA